MTLEHYCMVCDAVWEDYYDAISHVYTNHQKDTCGIAETQPEAHVGTREVVDT